MSHFNHTGGVLTRFLTMQFNMMYVRSAPHLMVISHHAAQFDIIQATPTAQEVHSLISEQYCPNGIPRWGTVPVVWDTH